MHDDRMKLSTKSRGFGASLHSWCLRHVVCPDHVGLDRNVSINICLVRPSVSVNCAGTAWLSWLHLYFALWFVKVDHHFERPYFRD